MNRFREVGGLESNIELEPEPEKTDGVARVLSPTDGRGTSADAHASDDRVGWAALMRRVVSGLGTMVSTMDERLVAAVVGASLEGGAEMQRAGNSIDE
jgi:hypothetical protein